MIEGSESGFVPVTNGSGSGSRRAKTYGSYQIRIPNTGILFSYLQYVGILGLNGVVEDIPAVSVENLEVRVGVLAEEQLDDLQVAPHQPSHQGRLLLVVPCTEIRLPSRCS
jgi:hypothetical protein